MAIKGPRATDEGVRLNFPFLEDGSPLDISTATTKQVTFKRNNTTSSPVAVSFTTDGEDGLTYYYTTASTFAAAGTYFAQGYVILPAAGGIPIRKIHSDPIEITIGGNN